MRKTVLGKKAERHPQSNDEQPRSPCWMSPFRLHKPGEPAWTPGNSRGLAIVEKPRDPNRLNRKDARCRGVRITGVLLSQGKHEQAERLFLRALGILEQDFGSQHPYVAYPLIGLAKAALSQRRFDTARKDAERAVAIFSSNQVAPEVLAKARFILAQGLWSIHSERSRARGLAEQAWEIFTKVGGAWHDDLEQVDEWLKTHQI